MSSSGPTATTEPGGIAACSSEAGLKARDDTAPIKLFVYNGTGSDLQLYRLDADGKRVAQGTIGRERIVPILTYVDSPWVIADASGKCLEVVLPGQQTRYHTVGESRADGELERAVSPRTAPQPGSEAMLRQYIEAVGARRADYDRMTSEVAAQTRQQLPFNQAILARLGALRSVTSAPSRRWAATSTSPISPTARRNCRIGLVKDGAIGRIALGPQY